MPAPASNIVFEVCIDHDRRIAADLETAMRHVARMTAADARHAESLTRADPVAEAAGASWLYRVRYAAVRSGAAKALLVAHDASAEPGAPSARDSYDLLRTFDPSFMVMRALYVAGAGAEPLEDEGAALAEDVYKAVRDGRLPRETDAQYVARLRGYQERFGGPEVIPGAGDAADILRRLPQLAEAAFLRAAAAAFPDDAPAVTAPAPR